MKRVGAAALSILIPFASCSDDGAAGDAGQATDTAQTTDTPVAADTDAAPDVAEADTADTQQLLDTAPTDVATDVAPDTTPDALPDTGTSDTATDTTDPDTGGEDTGGPQDTADTGTPDTIEEGVFALDPDTITFFWLPIGSSRFAVSGYSPKAGACVTIQWFATGPGMQCDPFSSPGAYVTVTPSEGAPCGQWGYTGNATVTAISGCVDFSELATPVAQDFVDLDVTIESPELTGTVRANTRSLFESKPVVLGLQYQTDVPEDVFVQTGDDFGLPSWARVTKDGAPVLLFDQCDLPICGEGGGACGIAEPKATNITGGDYQGSIYELWDGLVRKEEPGQNCRTRVPAEPGEYVATFCFGWSEEGGEVQSPQCFDQPLTWPAKSVIYKADFGG